MSCGSAFILITWAWKSQRNWDLATLISILACLLEVKCLWVSSGLLSSCRRWKCNVTHTIGQWKKYILQKFSKKVLKTCVWSGYKSVTTIKATASQVRQCGLARFNIVLCFPARWKLLLALAYHAIGCMVQASLYVHKNWKPGEELQGLTKEMLPMCLSETALQVFGWPINGEDLEVKPSKV